MTSETATKPETTKRVATREAEDTFQVVMREMRGAVDGVRRSVPEVARASRAAVDDMVSAMEKDGADRTQAGVTLSLGLAVGMLLGGAPRLLVLVALVPVAAMALALGNRRSRGVHAQA